MFTRYLRKFRWSIKARGLFGASSMSLARLTGLHGFARCWHYSQQQFDRYNRVRTRDVIPIESLDTVDTSKEDCWGYFPTSPESLTVLIDDLNIRYEDFTFIDFGSGMGRALLLASLFPFQKIVGVEFCESLHEQAQKNIASFQNTHQRCLKIDSVCGDATTFELPAGNLLLYFFNPFRQSVLSRVLSNIEQAHGSSEVLLVYCRPLHHQLLDESDRWTRLQFDAGADEPRSAVYALNRRPSTTSGELETVQAIAPQPVLS